MTFRPANTPPAVIPWRLIATGLIAMTLLGCGRESPTPPEAEHAVPVVATQPATTPVAAPKPTGPLPPDASCITSTCHADYTAMARVHGPVTAGACDACHQPDQGMHVYPLKRSGNALCTYCHPVAGTQTHQHPAVERDGCLACHNPHASRTDYLLTADNTEQLCNRCHVMDHERHDHEPFAKGECTACHQPHQADNPRLLRGGDVPNHCMLCHKNVGDAMAKASLKHPPAVDGCLNCHQPHGAAEPKLLAKPLRDGCLACHDDTAQQIHDAKYQHAATTQDDACANCHNPHAADRPRLLRDQPVKLCLTCHDKSLPTPDGRTVPDMTPQLTAEYLHGPVRDGVCADCHNPHGALNPSLLRKPAPPGFYASFNLDDYQLCFSCHNADLVLTPQTDQLTGFRDGDENLHYLHVHRDDRGRTCKTCHAMHGSDNPRHVADAVPFEGSTWAMPIHFLSTPTGGSCAPACHKPKAYDRLTPITPPVTTQPAATQPATAPAEAEVNS